MPGLHHVGYWVDDLVAAVRRAVAGQRIGPFLRHEHVGFDSFRWADGTEVPAPEFPAYFDHSAAFAAWGPVVVELAEIHSIAPELADAYGTDRSGSGSQVGHVSWVVDDLDDESARLEDQGCALIHTARSGEVEVAWHDGGPLFPHPIEVHLAGAPVTGMHQRLAALGAGWDGQRPLRPVGAPS